MTLFLSFKIVKYLQANAIVRSHTWIFSVCECILCYISSNFYLQYSGCILYAHQSHRLKFLLAIFYVKAQSVNGTARSIGQNQKCPQTYHKISNIWYVSV